MSLSPDDPTVRTAVFGKQVEDFLTSDVGTYLLQCASVQSEEATADLKEADPFKPEQIVAIQMRIKIADSVIGWLGDAVRAGQQATEHLREDA